MKTSPLAVASVVSLSIFAGFAADQATKDTVPASSKVSSPSTKSKSRPAVNVASADVARPLAGAKLAIGPAGGDALAAALLVEGSPALTADALDRLRVGDQITVASPDGHSFGMEVTEIGFMGPGQRKWIFKGESTGLLYGLIVANNDKLAGYLQAADGPVYNLRKGDLGYRLVKQPKLAPEMECGTCAKHSEPRQALIAAGGLAAGAICPPLIAPFGLPPGLEKDGGPVIDILAVYSVDATLQSAELGEDIPTSTMLAIELVNMAMKNSAEQTIEQFNGKDQNNQLIANCGYGADDADPTTAPLNQGETDGPPNQAGTGMPDDTTDCPVVSCGDSESSKAAHVTLQMQAPAEQDVYMPRLRLVGVLELDGFFGAEEPYDCTGWDLDLDRLQDPTDGYMDYIHSWQDGLGADMVMMIGKGYQDEGAGFAGLASVLTDAVTASHSGTSPGANADPPLNLPANPFPIIDSITPGMQALAEATILQFGDIQAAGRGPYCLIDVQSLESLVVAHELGHNMGCQHDHDNVGAQGGVGDGARALFPDSFGFPPTSEQAAGGFRTVMAYDGGGMRVAGYSNPNRNFADFGAPQTAVDPAGLVFDFACDLVDGDDTDAEWTAETGALCDSNIDPTPCTDTSDSMLQGNSPACGSVDAEIADSAEMAAYNARTISQTKYATARFRCSLSEPQDCNDNDIDDFIEAVDGFVSDCDQNGLPDDCETASDPTVPSPADCNANGIPDSCDIHYGNSEDANNNGMPDECEDATLVFSESFEEIPLGLKFGNLHVAPIPIALLSADAGGATVVIYVDPVTGLPTTFEPILHPATGDAYFATIETTGAGATGEGGYVYTDLVPSAFQFHLGSNGDHTIYPGMPGGFAKAFGSRGYGQMLNFNGITGDFPSQLGTTTINLATEVVSAHLQLNAANFSDFYDVTAAGTTDCLTPLVPLIPGALCANEIHITAMDDLDNDFTTTDDQILVFESIESLNGLRWLDPDGYFSEPNCLVRRFITAAFGSPEIRFDHIEITGAFVVFDNLGFDMGADWADCIADVAGGPDIGGLPSPDGTVGAEDILIVLAHFGTTPVDPAGLSGIADLNDDDVVDSLDLVEVLSAWGPCLGAP